MSAVEVRLAGGSNRLSGHNHRVFPLAAPATQENAHPFTVGHAKNLNTNCSLSERCLSSLSLSRSFLHTLRHTHRHRRVFSFSILIKVNAARGRWTSIVHFVVVVEIHNLKRFIEVQREE